MKQVTVVGHFAFGESYLDGQTVKTKTVTVALRERFGEAAVATIDTHSGFKRCLSLFFELRRALKESRHVLILPAHNGLRVIAPLLVYLNRKYGRGLHYAVIGGWLSSFLHGKPRLTKALQAFDGVYVETTAMRHALSERGFTNLAVMPNAKELPLLPDSPPPASAVPYPLCTFSRVMRQKGIEDAITAVRAVNESQGHTVFSLTVYGPVDSAETTWFENLKLTFPPYVTYGGSVPFDESVDTLRRYSALLFPTRFYTEGVPGCVLDAYAAGVPVIASRWENFDDVVEDEVTGYGYDFADSAALTRVLTALASDPARLAVLRPACLVRAKAFQPARAFAPLFAALTKTENATDREEGEG